MTVNYAEEVARGNRAKAAYEAYIKEHIETTVKKVYEGFEACHIDDLETLKTLKGLLSAIRGLESSIQADIDTGRLAEIALEKENE